MSRPAEPSLSRRERQILDVVYALGRASAAEVVTRLPDAPGKTAVRTFLRILEEKGHLVHDEEGRTYVYRPSRPRERAGAGAFRRVLDVFFGGSLEEAVAAHLGESAADLDDAQLKRLAGLIRDARKSRQTARIKES
ncbi:MAG: BlaI/MecI/CopY family transcriptional regulator [Planctomycetota bacterium]|nr:BlaI/MecI/CopY family transcriptional regulator [Planctomycetota bacterium]